MDNYNIEELNNKSTEELEMLKTTIYDDFVESLTKLPLDVRESFNYYINLARQIDIILNKRNQVENQETKLKI